MPIACLDASQSDDFLVLKIISELSGYAILDIYRRHQILICTKHGLNEVFYEKFDTSI